VTGILATMPYIALQLVGMQAVFETMGLGGSNTLAKDLPLLIAFAVLAAYTYSSGLRAPAMIAFVKDGLIYLVIGVAIIYLPHVLGGWDTIFDAAKAKMATPNPTTGKPTGAFIPGEAGYSAYWTLALGSAMALFMYPHSVTAVLSTKNRNVVRRNAAILPAYSLLLGLLALLGFMAITAKVNIKGLDGLANPQLAIPRLFDQEFPSWFAGIAFAAIAVGALVPAAIMSIAAANLFTRNIYRDFLKKDATPAQEAKVSKLASLLVKFGALIFVLGMDKTISLNLQLLGGIWILQTFPAIVVGLFTRWFHRWALLAGWAVAMVFGTISAYNVVNPATKKHFGGSLANIPFTEKQAYIGLTAVALNVIVTVVLTLILRALKVAEGVDSTHPTDYLADAGDPGVKDLPDLLDEGGAAPAKA
jgi:SSS family solute:Na+ symporter